MDEGRSNLYPCSICGRNFAEDVLGRHQNICAKTSQKKRKIFDSSKQRAEGTELAQVMKKSSQIPKKTISKPRETEKAIAGKKTWQIQHEEFIRTIRAARKVTVAINSGKPLPPPPPPTINPNYIQCPHCGRRFNESAAERHIEFCKTQHDRVPKGRGDSIAAKKQATRVNYQPPSVKPLKPSQTVPYKAVSNNKNTNMDNTDYDGDERNHSNFNGNSKYNAMMSNGIDKKNTGYPSNKPKYEIEFGLGVGNGINPYKTAKSSNNNNVISGGKNDSRTLTSGQVLRTGRTVESYTEAIKMSAKQRGNVPPSKKFPSSDSISPTAYLNKPATHGSSPTTQTWSSNNNHNSGNVKMAGRGRGSVGRGTRTLKIEAPSNTTQYTSTMAPGGLKPGARVPSSSSHNTTLVAGRFCYECGAKFPTAASKFCCECGSPKNN